MNIWNSGLHNHLVGVVDARFTCAASVLSFKCHGACQLEVPPLGLCHSLTDELWRDSHLGERRCQGILLQRLVGTPVHIALWSTRIISHMYAVNLPYTVRGELYDNLVEVTIDPLRYR